MNLVQLQIVSVHVLQPLILVLVFDQPSDRRGRSATTAKQSVPRACAPTKNKKTLAGRENQQQDNDAGEGSD